MEIPSDFCPREAWRRMEDSLGTVCGITSCLVIELEPGSSELRSLLLCLTEAGNHPFADNLPLELRHSADDLEEHPASRGRGVDGFLMGQELDAEALEFLECHDEMFEAAGESIEAPH